MARSHFPAGWHFCLPVGWLGRGSCPSPDPTVSPSGPRKSEAPGWLVQCWHMVGVQGHKNFYIVCQGGREIPCQAQCWQG